MTFAWRTDAPPNQVQLAVGRCLIDVMDSSRWTELGLLTDKSENIAGHRRLLRSLSFGDDDYGKRVYAMVPVLLAAGLPLVPHRWRSNTTAPPRAGSSSRRLHRPPHLSDHPRWPGPSTRGALGAPPLQGFAARLRRV